MDYLAHTGSPAGVTQISRALEINKSACFKILATLVEHELLVKEPVSARYRLGPRLVELGTASRRGIPGRRALRARLQDLVQEFEVVGLIGQVLANELGVVIVDRVLPGRRGALLEAVGEVLPLTAPALGKVILAEMDDHDALEIVRSIDGTEFEESEFLADLEKVRRQGFAASYQEYRPGANAVAAPVSGVDGLIFAVVALIGHVADLPDENLPHAGRRLAEAARAVENDLTGGDLP